MTNIYASERLLTNCHHNAIHLCRQSIWQKRKSVQDAFLIPSHVLFFVMDWLLALKAAGQSQDLRCDAEGRTRLQPSPEEPIWPGADAARSALRFLCRRAQSGRRALRSEGVFTDGLSPLLCKSNTQACNCTGRWKKYLLWLVCSVLHIKQII